MIVKNEERNIGRALEWARGVAFEQIVVDTGSTDRTAEIAEELGAKVFHFEWIDDFGAAKNFAISKARGSWIAFLDADEYLEEDDARRLLTRIELVHAQPEVVGINCDWLQLDDNGSVFAIYEQCRVFRKNIRYAGRIHEGLVIPEGRRLERADGMKIMHTGYTDEAFETTGKAERNIRLLREEIAKYPDSVELKCYLADALSVDKSNEAYIEEAERLYREAAESDAPLELSMRRNVYDHLLNAAIRNGDNVELLKMGARATEIMPDVPDYAYYMGLALQGAGDFAGAWRSYKRCETVIETVKNLQNRMTPAMLHTMFENMFRVAVQLGDWHNAIDYGTLVIMDDKYNDRALTALIAIMGEIRRRGLTVEAESIGYLQRFYDMDDPRDKLFLAKCAKEAKDEILMIYFYRLLTDEDKAQLSI
jgi:glycosyltransferase involved in cell wall biosynthesis